MRAFARPRLSLKPAGAPPSLVAAGLGAGTGSGAVTAAVRCNDVGEGPMDDRSEVEEASDAERRRDPAAGSATPPKRMDRTSARPSHVENSAVTSAGNWSEFLCTNPSVE
eukprot:scaffold137695_cov27-Tisochrysis_lutea.AAC.9